MSTLAVVDVTRRCAFTLAVSQTPPGEEDTLSRKQPGSTSPSSNCGSIGTLAGGCHLSLCGWLLCKEKYIDEVVRLDLHAITRLRSDADCVFLYTGPHPKRRGARRNRKVNFQALSRFEDLGTMEDEPHLHLYTAVVWHKTLQRRLRLVVLLNRKDPAKPRFIVLGLTDPELNGHKLVELYAARFQIEAPVTANSSPALDCQARAASALDFHFNASLATLNLVRAEDVSMQQSQEPHVFSMASWKQCQFNERLLDVFMKKLALTRLG